VRQAHALGIARRGIGIERELGAFRQINGPVGEFADPELRPLQIEQNADRPADFLFNIANHLNALAHRRVIGMTHVDAKEIGAGTI
jgi:hypothetical protein